MEVVPELSGRIKLPRAGAPYAVPPLVVGSKVTVLEGRMPFGDAVGDVDLPWWRSKGEASEGKEFIMEGKISMV